MPPRRQPLRGNRGRRTNTGEETPNIAHLLNEQFMASLPTIVAQVAAGFNAAQGNTGSNAMNGDAQRCTYKSFMSCKPKEFHGSEGAVGLLKWIEGMETVLHISKCRETDKVEYASCQLQDRAQTWWKTQMQIRGREAAYQLSWEEFTNLLMEEYCSKDERQKLESEFWNHTMVGVEIDNYTVRFQELARLVPHMVTPEEKRIDRYIWGLAPAIRGMVTSANPTTIQSAVDLANRLTSNLIRSGGLTKNDSGNKRKAESQSGKRAGGNVDKKQKKVRNFGATTQRTGKQGTGRYVGRDQKCDRCSLHHKGNCPLCRKCLQPGHIARFCKSGVGTNGVCHECGDPNHYRNTCPKLGRGPDGKRGDPVHQEYQVGQARGRVFVMGAEG